MGIVGLVLLCLLGLYMFLGGIYIWITMSDEEITPLSYWNKEDQEEAHTMLWGWARHFTDCIFDWWITTISSRVFDTLNFFGVVVVSAFLIIAFIAFLIEWIVVMVILNIPFVIIFIIFELLAKLGKFLFCKKQ